MVTQEASRTGKLDGQNISRYSPSSDYRVWFIGMSSSGGDMEDMVVHFAVHGGQLFLFELEDRIFNRLAEATFAEDWDSEADSIYDDL